MRATTMVAASRSRRRWWQLVLLGVLAGMVGGLAVAAIAGDRRSQSAAERLIEATAAPDAFLFVRSLDQSEVGSLSAAVDERLEADPDVLAVWPIGQFIGRTTEAKDWYYPFAGPARQGDISRPILVEGREVAEDSIDEVVLTEQTSQSTGLGVGDVISMDLYTPEQMGQISEDTEVQPAGSHLDLAVVGIVRDSFDIAPGASDRMMIASPAFYEHYRATGDNVYGGFAVRAVDGAEGIDRIVEGLSDVTQPGQVEVRSAADSLARIEPASRVLRVGVSILALVVFAIGSFVLAQVVRRHLASSRAEHRILRAIGFTRGDGVLAATLPGILAAVVAAVVAVAVAVAVSPVFPLGHPRVLEPHPGVSVDLVAIVPGALFVGLWTVGLFALMAWIDLDRAPRSRRREQSRLVTAAATVVPPSVLLGLHLTGDPGRARDGVRTRTAAAGAALGIAGLVAVTTFTASLDHLVTTPAEYGIDYDLSIEVPESQVQARLEELGARDDLDAVAEQRSSTVLVDGRTALGVAMESTKGSIAPVIVAGRAPAGLNEVAIGPSLSRDLGVELGSVVQLSDGEEERPATVVGELLDPTAVSADSGATVYLDERTLEQVAVNPPPYPILVVRFAPGADADAVIASLDEQYPYGVMDESFPHPSGSLRNLDDVRAVPRILTVFFGALTVVSLANGVLSGGRRARHAIGVVRGLGFTAGQVRAALAVMGVLLALGAVVVGVPLGAVAGAASWSRVSSTVDVVPNVQWAFAIAGIVVVAVPVLGVLASLWPTRTATRDPAAEVLRAE